MVFKQAVVSLLMGVLGLWLLNSVKRICHSLLLISEQICHLLLVNPEMFDCLDVVFLLERRRLGVQQFLYVPHHSLK